MSEFCYDFDSVQILKSKRFQIFLAKIKKLWLKL